MTDFPYSGTSDLDQPVEREMGNNNRKSYFSELLILCVGSCKTRPKWKRRTKSANHIELPVLSEIFRAVLVTRV